ncbi:MAG TPA: hypothetical protein GX697_06295, partial [Firmicutes bacterium]|nr:hypothetical protein [Bacillota bacterium]
NLYLTVQIIWRKPEITYPYSSISAQEVEEVKALLEEQGYYLETNLPRHAQRAALLSVNAAVADKDGFLNAFFPDGQAQYIMQENSLRGGLFYYKGKTLEFTNNGQVIYRFPNAVSEEDINLEEEDLKWLGEEFLRQNGVLPEDARFDGVYPTWSEEEVVSFYQEFEGVPVYGSYINLYVRAGHVVEMNYYWLEPLGFKEESPLVIPATQALLSFLEAQGRAVLGERDITDVSLGYYTIEYDAQKWDAVPVWRIVLSNGRKVYVNAYSGEIE